MAKIFSFNDKRNGSYIDRVSGAVGTPSGGGLFARTEKGLSWKGNESSKVTLGSSVSLGTVYSFSTWIRITDNGLTQQALAGTNDTSYPLSINPDLNWLLNSDGVNIVQDTRPELFDNGWHHVMVTRNNNAVNFYIDAIKGSFEKILGSNSPISLTQLFQRNDLLPFQEFCGRIQIFDHILTAKERAKLYSEFLNASPITRTIT